VLAVRTLTGQDTTTVGPRLVRGNIDFTPYSSQPSSNQALWAETLSKALPVASVDPRNINFSNNYSLYTLPESPQISPTKTQLKKLQNKIEADAKYSRNIENNIDTAVPRSSEKIKLASVKTVTGTGNQEMFGDREFFTDFPRIRRDRYDLQRQRIDQKDQYTEKNTIEPNPIHTNFNPQYLQPSKSLSKTYPHEQMRSFHEEVSYSSSQPGSLQNGNNDIADHCITDYTRLTSDNLKSLNHDNKLRNEHSDAVGDHLAQGRTTLIPKKDDAAKLLDHLKDIIAKDRNSEMIRLIAELQDVILGENVTTTTVSKMNADPALEQQCDNDNAVLNRLVG